ncbi:hypothetical protein AK830_g2017 [Neonectria ditissima]|uniref:Uncharacterized protein n=1 Tax=Neonectria ditissima TaxID=78410 RepID=A0A0P7BVW0_9HYPO|nr:hypothetical protein AK830_g2017 [Neonectria ditissima]
MEVLGAVASSMALLEISLKTADFLQGISEIQSDYEDLKLEISIIDAIIKDFQNVPRLFPGIPSLPQISEPRLMVIADLQLRDIRSKLEGIATHCAQVPDDKRSRAKKVDWILQRNKIVKLHQKARDVKSNLQTAMGFQTASLQALHITAGHRSNSEVIAMVQSLHHVQNISSSPVPRRTIEDVTDLPIEDVQTTKPKTEVHIASEVDSKDADWRLPQWLCARNLLFKAAYSSSGINCALRPARVLSDGDIVWGWIEQSSKSFRDPGVDGLMYFPDDVDPRGFDLTSKALSVGSFDVLELLLKRWANLLPKQGLPRRVGYVANSWLQIYVSGGCSREVDLIHQVLSFSDAMPEWQSTRPHEAAWHGEGMREALREEAWAMNELDHTGRAPLHIASSQGHVDTVKELIQAKANVNQPDCEGWTPLMYAAANNEVECMSLLLKAGCSTHQQDNNGHSAIHRAARRCSTDAVALLLAAGASASARGWWGRTPLHIPVGDATNTNPNAINGTIQLLLAARDGDMEARDNSGRTPAMLALIHSNLPVLRCLIQSGASTHTIDHDSRNFLHLAALYANAQVLQYLLSLEPKSFSSVDTELRDGYDDTPWNALLWTTRASLLQLGSIRRPSPAEQGSFAELLQAVRDENLNLEIRLMNRTINSLRQNHLHDARAQLAILINREKERKRYNLVNWYNGVDQKIQVGEFESVIEILTEDIEDCTAKIGVSPWATENEWGIHSPVCYSSASEAEDDSEVETLSSEDEDEASDIAIEAVQAEDEDDSEASQETGEF